MEYFRSRPEEELPRAPASDTPRLTPRMPDIRIGAHEEFDDAPPEAEPTQFAESPRPVVAQGFAATVEVLDNDTESPHGHTSPER